MYGDMLMIHISFSLSGSHYIMMDNISNTPVSEQKPLLNDFK